MPFEVAGIFFFPHYFPSCKAKNRGGVTDKLRGKRGDITGG